MTKAKSSTKRKLGEALVDATLHYIDDWAAKQIKHLFANSKFPVILKLDRRTSLVGNCTITRFKDDVWRLVDGNDYTYDFYSYKAAVFYSVFTKCGYYKSADLILYSDQRVGRYSDECKIYEYRLNQKNKKPDYVKQDIIISRYKDSLLMLESAKKELVKNLESAKYLKLWKQIL